MSEHSIGAKVVQQQVRHSDLYNLHHHQQQQQHQLSSTPSFHETSEISSFNDTFNPASPSASLFTTKSSTGSNTVTSSSTATGDEASLGNSIFYDNPEGAAGFGLYGPPDPILTQKAIERVEVKIEAIKEKIRQEQMSKGENVNEFLKLCTQADQQQQARMKQLFERKNQKSAQVIAQLQKKLEEYHKRLRELEDHGVPQKHSQKVREKVQGLKTVGGNIISKPKELAHRLRRRRFGSADNLSTFDNEKDNIIKESRNPLGSSSLPRDNPGARGPALYASEHQLPFEDDDSAAALRERSTVASERSDATSDSLPIGPSHISSKQTSRNATMSSEWRSVIQELSLHKEEADRLREELEEVKVQFKQELDTLKDQFREEREKNDRLEEQLNDLTELHQHEVENIKSGVRDMEEKVQYQSEERLMDIKEHLQGLEAKLNSLEHQQAQQQYINLDGLDNSDARAIFLKLLNALITVIHVGLFVVSTCLSLTKPFLRTKTRTLFTAIVLLISLAVYNQYGYLESVILHLFGAALQQQQQQDEPAESPHPHLNVAKSSLPSSQPS